MEKRGYCKAFIGRVVIPGGKLKGYFEVLQQAKIVLALRELVLDRQEDRSF